MIKQFMDFCNEMINTGAYLPVVTVATMIMSVVFTIACNRAKADRHSYIRALRMQETRMRREREALKRERMQWNCDYKVMCERNKRR